MDQDFLAIIEKQLEKTIQLLEEMGKTQSRPMLELILKRYKGGLEKIRNKPIDSLKEQDFKINGSVRAYLEAYSDYKNPLLEEMGKSEDLLADYFK